MLPGAAPPMKREDPVDASFDKPAETKVLEHANKVSQRTFYCLLLDIRRKRLANEIFEIISLNIFEKGLKI